MKTLEVRRPHEGGKTMTVAQKTSLRAEILEILKAGSRPLSVPEIEFKLKERNNWAADTFDVRDTVADLVREAQAVYVPGRLVQLAS
jgi:hypothetical protein